MKGGGIVQANQLAQIRKPNPFAVMRDLFQDGEGAAERLHAGALPVFGVVIDIALRRRHQFCDRGPAWNGRFLGGLLFGSWSHGGSSPRDGFFEANPGAALESTTI